MILVRFIIISSQNTYLRYGFSCYVISLLIVLHHLIPHHNPIKLTGLMQSTWITLVEIYFEILLKNVPFRWHICMRELATFMLSINLRPVSMYSRCLSSVIMNRLVEWFNRPCIMNARFNWHSKLIPLSIQIVSCNGWYEF